MFGCKSLHEAVISPLAMKSGKVMETQDGKKIIMTGNEVWRVDELLHSGHRH